MLCDKPKKNVCGQKPIKITRLNSIDLNVIVENFDVNYINEMISLDSPYNPLCSFCDINVIDHSSFRDFS